MAISVNTVWEIQTAAGIGNDVNGGGFVTGASGTDFSTAARRVATGTDDSTTDAVANGTTTITSATANFTAAMVGNIIYLQGGTGGLAITRKQVLSVTNATTIVLDAGNIAAGTGITMNIGGPLASLGESSRSSITNNIIWIKSGSYSITSATASVSGGCYSKGGAVHIEGYDATRGDLGTPPVLTASGITSATLISITNNGTVVNLELDGASLSIIRGVLLTNSGLAWRVKGNNFTNTAFISNSGSGSIFVECSADGCSAAAAFTLAVGSAVGCIASNGTFLGFNVSNAAKCFFCIAYNNSGATSDGFQPTTGSVLNNCVAYDNGRDGFRITSSNSLVLVNCIAEDNAGVGFNATSGSANLLLNCAAFSNGTDYAAPTGKGNYTINCLTGSASYFTAPGSGDFSLNNTAGGGADARAAGFPGVYPLGLTTGFGDIGAAQHQDGGGGGGGEHSSVF